MPWPSKFPEGAQAIPLGIELYQVDIPTVVYEDNTASISLASNSGAPHKKSKHFNIEWAFFKEAVELKEIAPVFVSIDLRPADMMTKALLSP